MLYNIVLFLHIIGVLLMFIGVGVTLTAMLGTLHARTVEALRSWSGLAKKADGLLPLSVIFILLPGGYLVSQGWTWSAAWVAISLTTLVLMTVMGPVINLTRIKAIHTAACEAAEGPLTAELHAIVRNKALWNSVSIMTMLAVAIVFLMTVKPGFAGSLLALAIAVPAGLFASAGMRKQGAAPAASAAKIKKA